MTTPERYRIVQRAMTENYIEMDPTTISLIPRVETQTDSGSQVWEDGPPRAPQRFKLISVQFTPSQEVPTITLNGVERIIAFYILGSWTCVMEVGDHWTGDDGRRYEIIALMDGHGYERKGAVEAHG